MANILLIEPDKVLADTYSRALGFGGHTVVQAFSAQEAIHAADQSTPDAVILELQLIGHDGIEFLQEFRSYVEWQEIPVIVLSNLTRGMFDRSRTALSRDYGVDDCLYKPRTTLRQLLHVLDRVLTT